MRGSKPAEAWLKIRPLLRPLALALALALALTISLGPTLSIILSPMARQQIKPMKHLLMSGGVGLTLTRSTYLAMR